MQTSSKIMFWIALIVDTIGFLFTSYTTGQEPVIPFLMVIGIVTFMVMINEGVIKI
jgi:hypothetical protein